jgi:uncharacterized protein YcbX
MKVTEINLYPIKSMRGTSLREALIRSNGLENDRCWILVDDEGKKITQRECPRLALLLPRVGEGSLRVQVPGSSDIVVTLDRAGWTGELLTVDLWGHEHTGVVAKDVANKALSDATGISCRLLWLSQGDSGVEGVPFHDDAPLLVISQLSLDDLNRRLPEPIPMNRFRPSVVVAGSDSFEEDEWQRIAIGETEFNAVKLCVRCAITTVDQEEGVFRGPEPLKTLATFRRVEQSVAFGAYFRPLTAGARIRVGDELEVRERKAVAASFVSRA